MYFPTARSCYRKPAMFYGATLDSLLNKEGDALPQSSWGSPSMDLECKLVRIGSIDAMGIWNHTSVI